MSSCNSAFADLSTKVEDILSSSFEESPRGDKKRVGRVASNLMQLLANSYYSLAWVNAKFANETKGGNIIVSDAKAVASASQSGTLKFSFDKARASFEYWMATKSF